MYWALLSALMQRPRVMMAASIVKQCSIDRKASLRCAMAHAKYYVNKDLSIVMRSGIVE